MTEQERAAALADEIKEELSQLREKFNGRENDHFSFGLQFSSWGTIVAALRLLAASSEVNEMTPEERARDGIRFRYLIEHCSSHYPMTNDQPAEWSICWEFQQRRPNESIGSFRWWIDQDIERQGRMDAEDGVESEFSALRLLAATPAVPPIVTDEMVAAALREWSQPNDRREASIIMRAALEAALKVKEEGQ